MIIKESVGGTKHGLAVPLRIPCHAKARLDIIRVGLDSFLQAQIVVSGLSERIGWFELWRKLNVVAHSVVQCHVRSYAPGILPECSQRLVGERIARTAKSLNEISGKTRTVGLDCGESRDAQARN